MLMTMLSIARDIGCDNYHEAGITFGMHSMSDYLQSIVPTSPTLNSVSTRTCYSMLLNTSNRPMIFLCVQVHPRLLQSIRSIHANRIMVLNKKEEMLGNFKFSTRGAIRRAPNIMFRSQLCLGSLTFINKLVDTKKMEIGNWLL